MASRLGIIPKKEGLGARFKSSRLLGYFWAGIIFLTADFIHAQLINVDFNNNSYGTLNSRPGPNPGPTMSGAAVLGTAGDQWNGISTTNGTGISLIYANGSASTVTMTFTSGGGYDVKNYGGPYPFTNTPYASLMEDYLYNLSGAKTITLLGLATNSTYSLVLYNAADNGAAGRTTTFTVNGNVQSSVWNGTSSTLIAGVDYVDFASALSDGSGNLVITYNAGSGSSEGDIDGFQIQPSPTVTITNPASSSVFVAPANVNIAANATVSSGTVTNVQFFTNGISLGSVLTAPFNFTASNLTTGVYALTAVAMASGISATSTVVNITVVGFPTVSITNPASGAVFPVFANVNIAANATVSSGTVTNVQFFTNGVSLGSVLTAPFSLTANNMTAGAYALTAVATAAGISATSSVVNVSVVNPTLTVSITNPPSGSVFITTSANVNIGASAAVSSGTVTNVQFFTNGVSLASDLTAPFNLTASNLKAGSYALTAVATAAGISATSPVVNMSVVSPPVVVQPKNVAAYTWTTLAGYPGGGNADGVGSAAQFFNPTGVAVDSVGNVYVADWGNNTIRRITPAGLVSTIAGLAGYSGSTDGAGSAARFFEPCGITVDINGNVYVADQINCTIRKVTPVGTNWVVTTIAGSPENGGTADGTNSTARFYNPQGLVVDGPGNLFVADTYGCTIRKITPVGTNWVVTTIAGLGEASGNADGTNGIARFNEPTGVAIDANGNIYVADQLNNTIRKVTPTGTNWVVTTIAVTNTSFDFPDDVVVDAATNIYVTDGNTIQKITPMGTNWVATDFAGAGGANGAADGTGISAQFALPLGLAMDSVGNLYVADSRNNTIRKITSAAVVSTIAGSAGGLSGTDGVGSMARFLNPAGAAVDTLGNVYVADSSDNTIRKISSLGEVSTIGGQAGNYGSTDGAGSNARFNNPKGVAVDGAGNVYVADTGNKTIRKITVAGVVTTVAGLAGNSGNADGTGASAQFYNPQSIVVDGASNLYVADTGNDTIRRITPVGTNWVVSTIAGSVTNSSLADGVGTNALFSAPTGIAMDTTGNLYVADSGNGTIRKITLSGTNWVVQTIIGDLVSITHEVGFGNIQTQVSPYGIAVDNAGNLYVADWDNTILEITPVGTSWVVSTIGGSLAIGGSAGSSDGAGSMAEFDYPSDVAVDANGNVYVADTGNNTIRKGVFSAYGTANPVSYTKPSMSGQLQVTLQPPEAGGQWRFPWEVAWRNSGQAATGLVAGNYPVEFSTVSGWLAIPASLTVAVTNGGTTFVTNQYYPTLSTVDTNNGGTLTVTLGPSPPGGAGWGFLGYATNFPSGYSTNLVAGTYLIAFTPVSGRVTPPNLSVQVQPGQTTYLAENYLLAGSAPAKVLLPYPVTPANISDLTDYPFGFNGQLQSDVGYGSGVAVQTNVVLTAAHMVFNDQTLSYVSQAYWYFQEEAGVYQPEPQAARGWYVLSGYAAQRTNDLEIYSPGTSTPQSRNQDVAALYFLSPVAGGGYGGYLPSDASPNPWLTGNSLKMLVGYPVDGSEFGDATIVPGEMYQTQPQPYALSLATDPVNDQQEVYTASWFLGYPGNSGGPVYAQFNGYYYPAGVYLGTLYSGVTPYASAVRAIDSDVVNLITNAAALGDNGTNHTGGGVITIIPNQALSAFNPGYMTWQLSPPSAVAAGAGWTLQGYSSYLSAPNSFLTVNSASAVVQFKPIPGWNLPANQTVSVAPGPNFYSASYTVTNPVLVASGTLGLGISGTTGTMYVIQRRSSLTSGSWINVSTNTITSGGFNLLLPNPATNGSAIFYRAVWLGQ